MKCRRRRGSVRRQWVESGLHVQTSWRQFLFCGVHGVTHFLAPDTMQKKPTRRNTSKVFNHVGVLVNEPSTGGVPFT